MSASSQPSKRPFTRLPRLAALPLLVASVLSMQAHADDATFDMDFFPAGTAPKMDLSRFARSGYVPPGTYRGDVLFNGQWRARTDIVFQDTAGSDQSHACFDADALAGYGVDWSKVVAAGNIDGSAGVAPGRLPAERFCAPLADYVPGAQVSFDTGTQVLSISVPQVYTARDARGYVDPSQWDAGIAAATVNYSAQLYRTIGQYQGTAGYLGVQSTFSLGGWHALHAGSLSWSRHGRSRYQATRTTLQHDLPALRAQLILGDTFTSGQLFDSVRVLGASLGSDSRMDPQSRRGYAPIVRGVSETNARLVIRQRGYVIYDTPVAPGPFAIDDLYPTGYGGDLEVELTEADGRIKHFSVPFSAVPQLLRPGSSRWAATAGKVDEVNLQVQPWLLQGTYERGLTNSTTAYAGSILSNGYHAALMGGAWNTPVGALSADLTQARNRAPGQSATQGVSARVGYNRNFINSGTDFSVAAYRYSTSGFVSLQDAVALRDATSRGHDVDSLRRQRSRMDLSVNQMLGEGAGLLFVNGSIRDFWGRRGNETEFSAGYNNSWKSLSYSLSVQRTRDSVVQHDTNNWLDIPGMRQTQAPTNAIRDTRLSFTVSVPLGRAAGAPTATGMFNHSRDGGESRSLSLAGAAGPEHRLAYGASLSESNNNGAYDLTAQYNGSLSQFAAGYSRGSGYQQLSGGITGGLVLHGGGITLAPPLGETIGLIHAPDAAGAHVENGQGAKVDRRGYAVVPYLMPYELNTITLDPKGTDIGVEIAETTRRVAPRAGAVVSLRYDTRSGRALIIQTRLPDGRPVPFGADVLDAAGNSVGVAGQASRLHVNGLQHSGAITVRWGDTAAESCRLDVHLPDDRKGSKQMDYETLDLPCVNNDQDMTPEGSDADTSMRRTP